MNVYSCICVNQNVRNVFKSVTERKEEVTTVKYFYFILDLNAKGQILYVIVYEEVTTVKVYFHIGFKSQ